MSATTWRDSVTGNRVFCRTLLIALWGAAAWVFLGSEPAAAAPAPGGQPAKAAEAAEPAGEDANPHLWTPRTRSVAVFKNGLGFFMREGQVRLRQGWCVAERVPPAAFGTLAVYALDEKAVVDVVGSGPGEVVEFDGRDAPDDPATKRARLEASLNLKLSVLA